MNRLIIESIEGRITLGITMFVALMILIGWIMINEPARMASFEREQLGRSIEQGAELFAASCTGCHGTQGQGIQGRAPGLNNPHLFEHDFTAEVNGAVSDRQRIIRDAYTLQTELIKRQEDLTAELGAETITPERTAEIDRELELIDFQLNPDVAAVEVRLAELEAIADEELTEEQAAEKSALENNIARTVVQPLADLEGEEGLLAQRDAVLQQLEPARSRGYLPRLDQVRSAVPSREAALAIEDDKDRATALLDWIQKEFALTEYIASDSSRLQQIGWGGDLRGYITTTLIHGRPGSAQVYPASQGGMVSWSQIGGGPLRRDQIDNIVNYILNFDKGDNWSIADLGNVQQFARLHADGANVVPPPPPEEIVQPVDEVAALPAGNAANGETLYTVNGCIGCHGPGTLAPATAGTWARIVDDRLSLPEFEGWTPEEYTYFSIVHPGAYVVEGFSNLMPATFGGTLSAQDISDLIAYLATQE